MKHLNNLSVLVLGLGESGLAMVRWCARHGAQVTVWDSREAPPQAAVLAQELPAVQRLSGTLPVGALAGVQLVLKSPGLAPTDERIAALLAQAAQTGVAVQGELDLFARALLDLKAERAYAPKVLAITGTNGKTTTTSMTAQLVARTGLRVAMAGNIGPTLLDTLSAALDLEPVPQLAEALETEAVDEAGPVPAPEPLEPVLAQAAADDVVADLDNEARQRAAAIDDGHDVLDVPVAQSNPEGLADAVVVADAPVQQATEKTTEQATEQAEAVAASVAAAQHVAAIKEALEAADIGGGGPPPHLIPPPPPGPVFEHLPEVWVLELSSFQLDGVQGFEPTAAAVLNITQDHLDWHGSMAAYAAAKARIFGQQAVMVINRDDPEVEALVPKPVPGKGRFAKPIERSVVRFGLEAPQHPGDFGLLVENGIAWLVRAMEADETIKRKRGAALDEDLVIQRLMPADALRVRGRHNAANALAALALATAAGCPLAPMLHGLREYAGEPHRVEFVTLHNGIEVYDDSKGTNVGATVAALNGLGADKAPSKLVVILGGDGKGQDFTPLATPVQRYVRAVATIGRDAQAIEHILRYTGVAVQRHESLEAATRWAFERAHSGDALLLSPACASLDMFRNYAHRAEVFVAEVHALVGDSGGLIA
jgi:UDP-N-acetylmuramoylalanine--D-glutamate ligase